MIFAYRVVRHHRNDSGVTAKVVGAITPLDVPDLRSVVAAARGNQSPRAADRTTWDGKEWNGKRPYVEGEGEG